MIKINQTNYKEVLKDLISKDHTPEQIATMTNRNIETIKHWLEVIKNETS